MFDIGIMKGSGRYRDTGIITSCGGCRYTGIMTGYGRYSDTGIKTGCGRCSDTDIMRV